MKKNLKIFNVCIAMIIFMMICNCYNIHAEERDNQDTTYSANGVVQNGMIDNDILEKSIELRNAYLELERIPDMLNVETVKTSEKWKNILRKSDEISELLYW